MTTTADPPAQTRVDRRTNLVPSHGFTKRGHAVHGRTVDHLPNASAAQRFNKHAALAITNTVGTMWAAYLFALLALSSLPAIIQETGWIGKPFPSWIVSASLISLVLWISSEFLQLVLLPIIIVGQNVQSLAADARAAKTFEDTESIVQALDLKMEGGLTTVYQGVEALRREIAVRGQLLRRGHGSDLRDRACA
jgi:hypothetical protein